MRSHVHKVQNYETDKMGIAHHSNYIRWMEEARASFFEQIGWPLGAIEAKGVSDSVESLSIRYKHASRFSDMVIIGVRLVGLKPGGYSFSYEMFCNGEVICTAKSENVFADAYGYPVRIDDMSGLFESMKGNLEQAETRS